MVDSNKFKIKIFNKNKNEVFYSDLLDIFLQLIILDLQ